MAVNVQYNKTFLQQLNKELKVREKALPILQAKEAALRSEVKKAKQNAREIDKELENKSQEIVNINRLWSEFPKNLLKIDYVELDLKKIAGVKTPVLKKINFIINRFSLFSLPSWIPAGIEILRAFLTLKIEKQVALKKIDILEYARKKTTQKVNLYEKVQIPDYQEAIRKVKRFMEDEDNLAKSSMKILKARLGE